MLFFHCVLCLFSCYVIKYVFVVRLSLKMAESDHEEGDMEKLELSSDSQMDIITKKRPRVEDSEDEARNSPVKKQRNSSDEQSEILKEDNAETILDKNGTDEHDTKEENQDILESEQNALEKFLSKSNMDEKEEQDIKIKQKSGDESLSEKDSSMDMDESITNTKKEVVYQLR